MTPPPGFTSDTQLVFAPHPYSESITLDQSLGLTIASIERNLAMSAEAAKSYGAALWLGEWGWFGDPDVDGAKVQRFVAAQDRLGVGGAFWVWRQGCGSPETGDDAESSGNFVSVDCRTGALSPPPAGFAQPLSRAYPRAFPGRLDSLASGGSRPGVHRDRRRPRRQLPVRRLGARRRAPEPDHDRRHRRGRDPGRRRLAGDGLRIGQLLGRRDRVTRPPTASGQESGSSSWAQRLPSTSRATLPPTSRRAASCVGVRPSIRDVTHRGDVARRRGDHLVPAGLGEGGHGAAPVVLVGVARHPALGLQPAHDVGNA